MRNRKRFRYAGWVTFFTVTLCLCTLFSFVSSGVDDGFEKTLAAFPESYRPYLRELHKMYPDWIFEPFETGLNFNDVIDNETGAKSLVSDSASSENFKSRDEGDYDFSTGKYIHKDGGFVEANRLAVEYFIDPRNFLTEENIFQFENLAFSDSLSISSVEAVLKGSFMENAYMDHYDKNGEQIKGKKKYSQAIYEAGKKYNINPCYLASKIRNEVGSDGSASSSGKHSEYPGIYNLYNIGATDGVGAIGRGLNWASSGSTYGRPWTSPYKSIMGGAQYIAEKYIGIGQFTGYLQRFNVNPNAEKPVYTHQYMTNLTGALSQGYTNYNSYARMGLLYREIVFSIPIYKNMPPVGRTEVKSLNADSTFQKGKISATTCFVRTGTSTNNAKLYDKNNSEIKLYSGHSVEILGKAKTDATYYLDLLKYPHWYQIRFTYNSETYTGYVPATFVEISDVIRVNKGEYDLNYLSSADEIIKSETRNGSIAVLLSENKVKFLKTGTVEVITYDASGNFDKVKYEVVSSETPAAAELFDSVTASSFKVTSAAVSEAKKYAFVLVDSEGKIVKKTTSSNRYYTFSKLKAGEFYTCYVRPILSEDTKTVYGIASLISAYTLPKAPEGFKGVTVKDGAEFSWKKVEGAEGYILYGYDVDAKKYVNLGKTTDVKMSISAEKLVYDFYCAKAYIKVPEGTVYSPYSDKADISVVPVVPQNIKVSDVTSEGYVISWENSLSAEGYKLYVLDKQTEEFVLVMDTDSTFFTEENKHQGERDTYKLKSYNSYGGYEESDFTEEFTVSTLPEKTAGVEVKSTGTTSVTLKWNKAGGADFYRIYKRTGSESILHSETKELSIQIKGLAQFTKYSFYIVPCVQNLSDIFEGEGKELEVITDLAKVTGLSCTEKGTNYFVAKWKENPAAEEYYIYLYNSKKKVYEYKAKTKKTSYKISGLSNNKIYYFKVKAKATVGEEKVLSDYSSKCSVKTGIPAPTGLKATAVKTNIYTLSWKAVPGAYSYRIYKKSGNTYKLFTEVKNGATSYKVTGLSAGSVDYYKVTTMKKSGSKYYESPKTAAFSVSTLPSKPAGLTEKITSSYVTLSWKAVKGATSYKVYIYNEQKKAYSLVEEIKDTSYKLTSLTATKTYKYAVKACIKTSAGNKSSSSAFGSFLTKPGKVGKVSVSSVKSDSHVLSWNKVSGANFYYVYRYNPYKKNYTNVGGTSGGTYTVKSLVSGTTYKYKIISAYLQGGECIIKGDSSAVYSFTTAPVKVSSLKVYSIDSSNLTLSWAKPNGATGYEIYYYDSSVGDYLMAGETEKTTFTVKGLSSKKSYKLKVRAYRSLSGKKYFGDYSSVLTVKTK